MYAPTSLHVQFISVNPKRVGGGGNYGDLFTCSNPHRFPITANIKNAKIPEGGKTHLNQKSKSKQKCWLKSHLDCKDCT